jgi:pimeloyl-ACP methyl ester carboxylesterase
MFTYIECMCAEESCLSTQNRGKDLLAVTEEIRVPFPDPNSGIEECWMEIDGGRMRYLRAGSGPPLILLHGLMGYSFSWRFTMPALAPHAIVYAPDMLGAGFSDRPPGIDHSLRGTADRILHFVRNLGITSFDLLGTSRGGAVAMMAASECLNGELGLRIRKLILVAPVNPFSRHGRLIAPLAGSRFGSMAFRRLVPYMDIFYPYWHGRMYGDRSRIPPGTLEGYKAPLAKPGLFEHALSIVGTWTEDLRQLQEILPRLSRMPTLLMWGSKDTAVHASSAVQMQRYFPDSEMIIFPGIGHLPYEECPEEFNRALIGFLVKPI